MRILVVGAGAIGGYFGARLLEARRDVTFLVRPRRARQLAEHGLVVRSRLGDAAIVAPPTVLADALDRSFDLVLLSCKSYDLDGAMASFAPAVGSSTLILPILNGMGHMDALDARFGANRVLGGLCIISSTLDAEGRIQHLNDTHALVFGERDGASTPRIEALKAAFADAKFEARLSPAIVQEMWEKWVFIASLAALSCLMRAPVGDIVAAGGAGLGEELLDECAAIAAANGFVPRENAIARVRAILTDAGSSIAASMLRDLEGGGRTEADHVLGDLLRRSPADRAPMLLKAAYTHMKIYEARRSRQTSTP